MKSFIVTYDRLYDKSVINLTNDERKGLVCYNVQKSIPKSITNLIDNSINEWELPWNDYRFQQKQYYEYSAMIHLFKNPSFTEDSNHIGIFHYDVSFDKRSIDRVKRVVDNTPNVVFYQRKRGLTDLYLQKHELQYLCKFMSERLGMRIDETLVWDNGWISEALSITPKPVFMKFSKFLFENFMDIEKILLENHIGIMDRINHRVCGIIERMWGTYLVNCNVPMIQLQGVNHDWNDYQHKHCEEENWIKNKEG